MAFFSKRLATLEANQGMDFIHVGPESFHALAVALIDALKYGACLSDLPLKKILDGFISYYPKLMTSQVYLSASERMGMLINNASRKSDLVDCMAYVLRQIAVDAIYAQPVVYQDAFEGLRAQTSIDTMREPTTELSASALIALADALKIKLTLSLVAHGKEVRALEIYDNAEDNLPKVDLSIQVQGETFFPKVNDKKEYAYVGHLPARTTPLVEHTLETIAPMLDQIAADNKRIFVIYEQTRKTLLSMVLAGELSKEQLIDCYVDFLPTKDRLYTEAFFSKLEHLDKMPVAVLVFDSKVLQQVSLLIKGIAGWVSTKQLNENHLFDRIEGAKRHVEKPRA